MDESPTTILQLKQLLKDRGYTVLHNTQGNMVAMLPNGYCVSVGWGPGHYCQGRFFSALDSPWLGRVDCPDAEIAVWTTESLEFIRFEGWEYETKGWVRVPEILRIIDYLAGK